MPQRRPLIAVTPLMDYKRDSLWMIPGYMQGIIEAGGTPIMLPLCAQPEVVAQCAERFDGFLFTGGPDVGPWVRPIGDGRPGITPVQPDAPGRHESLSRERDEMEVRLLEAVLKLDKPVFGICRGIQLINRVLGGTLWQDLPTEHPSGVEHHMTKPPYDSFGHHVSLVPGTPLAALFAGERSVAVNSYHHQAVRELAPGLETMAVAPDGVIEALWRSASRFLWAVQWHPEFLHKADPRSRQLFAAFVGACRG